MYRFIVCLSLCCTATFASAQNYHYSSSTRSQSMVRQTPAGLSLELVNAPLEDALQQIAQATQVKIWAQPTVIDALKTPVSIKATRLTAAQAAQRILATAKLHLLVDEKQNLIVTADKISLAEASAYKLVSLSGLKIESSLKKQVPLMMFHTPLQMGLQMVEGFGGVKVHIDEPAIRKAGINLYQPVSLSGQPATLARSLDQMLHPQGLDWYVSDEGIVVTTKARKVKAYEELRI